MNFITLNAGNTFSNLRKPLQHLGLATRVFFFYEHSREDPAETQNLKRRKPFQHGGLATRVFFFYEHSRKDPAETQNLKRRKPFQHRCLPT